jgi:DNA-binding transcriptional regulator YiaG
MKTKKVQSLRDQLLQSLSELKEIADGKLSPYGDGRFTVNTVQITKPSKYNAATVKRLRARLKVSQGVFAEMLGVSQVLVRSWERGARTPSSIASRLLDQMRKNPTQFTSLIHLTESKLASKTRGRKAA